MVEMTLTAKIKIEPTEHEARLLKDSMDAYRRACNRVSRHVFSARDLKQSSLNASLYRDLRDGFGLRSQMAQSAIKTVIARYKAILSERGEWAEPKFRKPQLDLVWNRDYSLRQGLFSVNTLKGRVKVRFCAKGMEQWFQPGCRFGTARLVLKRGKFFLHIPVTFEVPECKPEDVTCVVGVDRGINFTIATYDSKGRSGFVKGRPVKQRRARYKRLRQQLQRRKTPSARRRLKAIGRRENRWMQDVNHSVSKALVDSYGPNTLFVLEDLEGVRAATERVSAKNRYVSVSWSFYDLEQKIVYKARRNGSLVAKVDPAYTSQACPKCGHTERANRDKRRHEFRCKTCGYRSNDDRIGAMNLHRKGIELLVPDAVAVRA